MPGNKSSAGSFCSLVVSTTTGASDSVESLLLATLGNGAEVYCIANASAYRMNGASTQATLGDTFIKPLSGLGCWVKQDAESDYTFAIEGTSSFRGVGTGGSTAVLNTWTALPNGAGFYVRTSGATPIWALDTSTGIVTYSGPSGKVFVFSGNLSIAKNTSATPLVYEFDITVNGGQLGTVTNEPSASAGTVVGVAGIYGGFSQTFLGPLNNGDTIQHCFRRITAAVGSGTETFSNYAALIRQA